MAYNEELAARMRTLLKSRHGLVEKKMFGGIGFLVNGNMACGIHKQDLIVRLGDNDFDQALKQPHVRIFNMTGRPMKGWIMVSGAGYSSEKALMSWIDKSLTFAKSLPRK